MATTLARPLPQNQKCIVKLSVCQCHIALVLGNLKSLFGLLSLFFIASPRIGFKHLLMRPVFTGIEVLLPAEMSAFIFSTVSCLTEFVRTLCSLSLRCTCRVATAIRKPFRIPISTSSLIHDLQDLWQEHDEKFAHYEIQCTHYYGYKSFNYTVICN
ncbi:hypothetical protein CPB84DRAFT_948848 [Gymnopilus junonius]|uniref:Uncharacterized protein n=1 Tax=Gymnopilus junonius TaxID=109634 RepID=A0A9P5NQY2_GYMJU|nr:hypothetical protein CPB84DRAFT_948848 [Gymnopilus junonius]